MDAIQTCVANNDRLPKGPEQKKEGIKTQYAKAENINKELGSIIGQISNRDGDFSIKEYGRKSKREI